MFKSNRETKLCNHNAERIAQRKQVTNNYAADKFQYIDAPL